MEVAFGKPDWPVEGVAGVERYVRGGPVGVAVPVLYQRADGSAHAINAVRTGSKDPAGHDVVVLWDPQRGEEAEKADVSAVTGMWVIPVPEPEPDQGMVVLPPSGSGLRSQGWGSGLPTEVAGSKRQPGESGPEAGKTGAGAKRTRGRPVGVRRGRQARVRGLSSGGRWQQPRLGLTPAVRAMAKVGCSPRRIRQHNRTSGRRRGKNSKAGHGARSIARGERLLPIGLRSWRSWRGGGVG
ncbi:hypothetical protein [Saccharopolyspora spinosa]|uniref:hypothetical protein n=1 Tax=Saccharopolyspora spinosa TaxID=60894 RepID=UPI00376EDEEF